MDNFETNWNNVKKIIEGTADNIQELVNKYRKLGNELGDESMAEIDSDFNVTPEQKQEIKDYLLKKYGNKK